MGTLQCQVCKITADAENKETAISKIDHGANSKNCNGKDENCIWYSKGVPEIVLNPVVDPKRPIQGVTGTAKVTKAAPKKSSK